MSPRVGLLLVGGKAGAKVCGVEPVSMGSY